MGSYEGILGSGLNPTTKIYRTVTFRRLIELFSQNKNALVRPILWADTFEDLLGQSVLRIGSRRQGKFRTDHIYGQCWTLHTVSDAIWKIYSDGDDGFRLRSTVSTLLESLKSQVEDPDIRCYIGKVRYLGDKQLLDFGRTHFADPQASPSEVVASAYLVKRIAFQHEKEVRLVYLAPSAKAEGDLFRYSIKPNDLIDQIMVHPLVPYAKFERLKQKIRSTGFSGEVVRSLLYSKPSGFEFRFEPNSK